MYLQRTTRKWVPTTVISWPRDKRSQWHTAWQRQTSSNCPRPRILSQTYPSNCPCRGPLSQDQGRTWSTSEPWQPWGRLKKSSLTKMRRSSTSTETTPLPWERVGSPQTIWRWTTMTLSQDSKDKRSVSGSSLSKRWATSVTIQRDNNSTSCTSSSSIDRTSGTWRSVLWSSTSTEIWPSAVSRRRQRT